MFASDKGHMEIVVQLLEILKLIVEMDSIHDINIYMQIYIYMSMVHIYYLMYILDVPSCVHHLYNDEDELQSDICIYA